jgi:hypothetical protein
MKWIRLAALLGVLAWPAAANADGHESSDFDLDGVVDELDNCSETPNTEQDDTDGDGCGNLCDADYDQNGVVGFGDFGIFAELCFKYSPSPNEVVCHVEPIPGCTCGFGDFGFFAGAFGEVPGPSGNTTGNVACP